MSQPDPYDAGYFAGRTSGYGPKGYTPETVDWSGWLEIIQQFQPGGTLCDLGCAFGYLVAEARNLGYAAVGGDISSFAVSQNSELSPWLFHCDVEALPFPDQCFDVVCIFDVLEHAPHGDRALAEAVRILEPSGLLIGTTPDPIFFDREEPTHCFERPPAYWVEQFDLLGLESVFRFSGFTYNFQFVAQRRDPPQPRNLQLFGYDYFGDVPEFLQASPPLSAIPRLGWGPLKDQARPLEGERSRIYLLNPGAGPLRGEIRFEVRNPDHGFAVLRLSMDGLLLREMVLTSEIERLEVTLPNVPIPRGGHNLSWELRPLGPTVEVADITIGCSEMSSRELCLTLPFDLFQRYQMAATLVRHLRPGSILDVGGLLGDAFGHMACSSDFLGGVERVVSSDIRPADLPEHYAADALALPFEDAEFETVLSLDVFEHLPPSQRDTFLDELDRVASHWILIGFPVLTPEVELAERQLLRSLLKGHRFLEEHQEFGLPSRHVVEVWSEKKNYSLRCFASGYLPHWTAMQALTRLFFESGEAEQLRQLNRLYNSSFFESDRKAPSYRQIFLVSKHPGQPRSDAFQDRQPEELTLGKDLLGNPRFLELQRQLLDRSRARSQALSEAHFLAGERQKEIELLYDEVKHLKQELQETPLWRIWRRRNKARRSKLEDRKNSR